jgi:hypothetical protein
MFWQYQTNVRLCVARAKFSSHGSENYIDRISETNGVIDEK